MDFRLSYKAAEGSGEVELPGSKSITNRVLIINALSENPTRIEGIAQCDDTYAIIDALKRYDEGVVDVGASGTAMRFLTAFFAARPGVSLTLTGSDRMLCRPIKPLVDSLIFLGANVIYKGEEGFPPLHIVGKHLKGGNVGIRGDVSSQFVSALMIIGATLRGGLTIHLLEDTVSRPYIDMTCEVMRRFGVDVRASENVIEIPEQTYLAPISFKVEADWSSASYFYELVALGGARSIKLSGLKASGKSLQGDAATAELFQHFGVGTSFYDGYAVISDDSRSCDDAEEMLELNLSATPDLVPAMVVTACLRGRRFLYRGIHNLRIKESDRISTLVSEMRRLGYFLRCDSDSIGWEGERCEAEATPYIRTHSDHRLAMAFAPAIARIKSLVISDAMVVNKSFPRFWSEMRKLGITTEVV